MKTYLASACHSPVQLVLFDVYSEELDMIKIVGEQVDGVQTIHVCRCHLGRYATLCSLVCPIQFACENIGLQSVFVLLRNFVRYIQ